MAKFCTSCGNSLGEDQKFCNKCGAPIGASAAASIPAGTTPPSVTAGDMTAGSTVVPPAPRPVVAAPATVAPKRGSSAVKVIVAIVGFLALISVLAIANIPRTVHSGKPVQAFASSTIAIATLVALFGLALYPNLVTANNDPALSLTVFNAASSPGTLKTMLVFALVGMPFVLVYTALVYRAFRGHVRIGDHSY